MVRRIQQALRHARESQVRAYQVPGDPTGMTSVAIGEAFRGRTDSVVTTAKVPDNFADRPMEGTSKIKPPDPSRIIPAISAATVSVVRYVGGGGARRQLGRVVANAIIDYYIAKKASDIATDALKNTGGDAPEAETDKKKKK